MNSEEFRGQVFPIARDLIPELIQIDELLKRIEIETEVLN